MNVKVHKRSLLYFLREYINLSESEFIYRKDLIKISEKRGNDEKYLDSLRRQLTVAGYLEDTEKQGIYKIKHKIPLTLNTDKLNKMVKNIYENNKK